MPHWFPPDRAGARWRRPLADRRIGTTSSTRHAAPATARRPDPHINFAAYSTPREVYDARSSPRSCRSGRTDHDDQNAFFQESYAGSTTQAQNVVNG